jgi:hypothetical protein
MSQPKMDRVSRPSGVKKAEAELMEGIVRHLRKIGGVNTSAIKRIARETGTNPRTVKAWYEGRNMPSLLGYIHLARCYPELIDLFLNQCQRRSNTNTHKPFKAPRSRAVSGAAKVFVAGGKAAENVGNDVGINVRINGDAITCNMRQMWFISQLGEGIAATAATLARRWNTSQKTAERDIRQLRHLGLIVHQGARRNGRPVPAQAGTLPQKPSQK